MNHATNNGKLLLAFLLLICGSSLQSQPDADKLHRLYTDINDICRTHDIKLPVPRILVIGMQSAGKTTLLELYAGFPIGYTSAETGTRCAVEYTFVNDPDVEFPLIEFNGIVVSETELLYKITKVMQELTERNTFSEQIVRVKIVSRDVTNIVLIDVPGIIPSPKPEDRERAEQVERIVQKFARNPEFSIVAVLKCTESSDTLVDLPLLDTILTKPMDSSLGIPPPRVNWKQDTCFIVNYFNDVMRKKHVFPNPTKAKMWIENQQKDGRRYFVVLKPDDKFVREDAENTQVRSFIKAQPDLEKAMIQNWIDDLGATEYDIWDENLEQFLGLKNARLGIEEIFITRFKRSIPDLKNTVNSMLNRDLASLGAYEALLRKLDPQLYKKILREYSHDYGDTVVGVFTGQILESPSRFVHAFQYGKTWDEELALHTSLSEWQTSLNVSDTASLLTSEHLEKHLLGKELSRSYVGVASITRAVKLTSYFIYNLGIQHASDNEIWNLAAWNPHKTDQFPFDYIVHRLLRAQLQQVAHNLDFLKDHIFLTTSSLATIAEDFLLSSPKYKELASDEIVLALCQKMSRSFASMLLEQLTLVTNRTREHVDMYSSYIRTDLPIRSWMAAIVVPIEDIIVSKGDLDPELPKATDTDSETTSLGDVEPAGSQPQQYHRSHKQHDFHALQVMDVLGNLQRLIWKNSKLFSFADIVEGGFVTWKYGDRATIDLDYLRACVYQLYVQYVFWIVFDAEMAVQHYVINYFNVDGKAKLKLDFGELIDGLTAQSIANSLGIDKDSVEAEIQQLDRKISALQSAHAKLEKWDHVDI